MSKEEETSLPSTGDISGASGTPSRREVTAGHGCGALHFQGTCRDHCCLRRRRKARNVPAAAPRLTGVAMLGAGVGEGLLLPPSSAAFSSTSPPPSLDASSFRALRSRVLAPLPSISNPRRRRRRRRRSDVDARPKRVPPGP